MSHPLAQALIVGSQKGSLAACSSIGSFYERLTQPAVALAGGVAEPFACTDISLGTEASPGTDMRLGRKAIHSRADFRHDNLTNAHIDAGHLIEEVDHLSPTQHRRAFEWGSRRRHTFSKFYLCPLRLCLCVDRLACIWVRIVWAIADSQSGGYLLIQLRQLPIQKVELAQLTRE